MNQTELKKLLNARDSRQKYGNHKVHCLSKHLHDSKLEANYCNRLLAMQQKGEIAFYGIQRPFEFWINGSLICTHIVDFIVCYPNYIEGGNWDSQPPGSVQVHDTKGVKTDVFIIKHKLFKALYPHIEYKIITAH